MLLEEKIRYIQGSVLQLQLPELVMEHSPLQFDKISKAGALIEEKQRSIQLKAEAAALTAGGYKEHLHRLRRELHMHPQKDWSGAVMAETLGISVSHLQRMYKAEFGIGCKDDLIAARMERAKQLLRNTDLQVQEIASACGYADGSHFMRQFKEKVGMSALQFRKQKK